MVDARCRNTGLERHQILKTLVYLEIDGCRRADYM